MEGLLKRYYPSATHPYRLFERNIASGLNSSAVVLDVGCGYTAPVLRELAHRCHVIGIDVVDLQPSSNIALIRSTGDRIPLADDSVDVVICRSVLEHVEHPSLVLHEIRRVLRPNGRFVFLTPNRWDYASIGATLIPNRLHPWIVRKLEGRAESDTFPTYYRANTKRALHQLAHQCGFSQCTLNYLGQYPSYFCGSLPLFLLGMAWDKFVCHWRALSFLRSWILGEMRT